MINLRQFFDFGLVPIVSNCNLRHVHVCFQRFWTTLEWALIVSHTLLLLKIMRNSHVLTNISFTMSSTNLFCNRWFSHWFCGQFLNLLQFAITFRNYQTVSSIFSSVQNINLPCMPSLFHHEQRLGKNKSEPLIQSDVDISLTSFFISEAIEVMINIFQLLQGFSDGQWRHVKVFCANNLSQSVKWEILVTCKENGRKK